MDNEARMRLVEEAMTIVAEGMALPYEHLKYGMTEGEYEVCKPGMLKYARFCVQELSKTTIEVTAEMLSRCAYIFISDMDRRFLESNPEDVPAREMAVC